MDALRKLQNEFLAYLLDNTTSGIIERIESTPQRSAMQRINFYGNAYTLRLKEALSSDFERLHTYLGDDLFETLMMQYIEHYPSHHTSLRYFGQHMVELIAQAAPFNTLPEVAEIAGIELAFANSFDATDDACVTHDELAQLEAEAWPTLRLRFHTAVQLLPQQCNSFPIWRALANDETPPPRIDGDTTWLLWRHDLVSRYRALDKPELAALGVALSAGNFAELCEVLLEYYDEQQTPQHAVGYLQQWINDQMVCGFY